MTKYITFIYLQKVSVLTLLLSLLYFLGFLDVSPPFDREWLRYFMHYSDVCTLGPDHLYSD